MKVIDIASNATIETVISFVKSSPVDELYTRRELTEKFGLSESTLRRSTELQSYRVMYGENYYYGSLEAVKALKALIG